MLIPEDLVRGQIKEGKIYRFYDTVPEGSDVVPNHFHVCFRLNGAIVYLLCCTTKKDTIDNYIRVNHLDQKTKVYIAPTPENGLKKDTYLNCNNTMSCDFNELVKAIGDGSVTYSGEIDDDEYQNIRIGILSSAVVPPAIKQLVL